MKIDENLKGGGRGGFTKVDVNSGIISTHFFYKNYTSHLSLPGVMKDL